MSSEHAVWLGAAALVIGALVKALKSGRVQQYINIPRQYLPWIALTLGLTAAVIRIVLDKNADVSVVVDSMLEGVLSGMVPVAVHELGTKR